ncbi:hypothetical protein [Streptomyces eurythermus]|uniref:hypothetical protein n=1 Tax=Streptomyces eurythermus TaxID=42237 RepID=UPI0036D36495
MKNVITTRYAAAAAVTAAVLSGAALVGAAPAQAAPSPPAAGHDLFADDAILNEMSQPLGQVYNTASGLVRGLFTQTGRGARQSVPPATITPLPSV